jgi:hypothetical protein
MNAVAELLLLSLLAALAAVIAMARDDAFFIALFTVASSLAVTLAVGKIGRQNRMEVVGRMNCAANPRVYYIAGFSTNEVPNGPRFT